MFLSVGLPRFRGGNISKTLIDLTTPSGTTAFIRRTSGILMIGHWVDDHSTYFYTKKAGHVRMDTGLLYLDSPDGLQLANGSAPSGAGINPVSPLVRLPNVAGGGRQWAWFGFYGASSRAEVHGDPNSVMTGTDPSLALMVRNTIIVEVREKIAGGSQLGFFGTAPIDKPDVAGAKGGNVALANLLTALAALGLLTDSST